MDLNDLVWRSAALGDRGDLQNFVCTDPPKYVRIPGIRRKHHPTPWELVAQLVVRDLGSCTPVRPPMHSLVAVHEGTIAGVCLYEFEPAGHSNGLASVEVVAIAQQFRGYRMGDAIMLRLADDLTGLAESHEVGRVEIYANVDPRNEKSRALMSRHGWAVVGRSESGDLDVWKSELPTPS